MSHVSVDEIGEGGDRDMTIKETVDVRQGHGGMMRKGVSMSHDQSTGMTNCGRHSVGRSSL
jgi:hypothetical protein